jgi:hypothetical protein
MVKARVFKGLRRVFQGGCIMYLRLRALVIIVIISACFNGKAYSEKVSHTPVPISPIIAIDGIPDDVHQTGFVKLRWTAPGDDNNIGMAARYEMRFRGSNDGPIDSWGDWAQSTIVPFMPDPSVAGHRDSVTVRNLIPHSLYYFCIITYDEAGNRSSLSNSPMLYIPDPETPIISSDLDNSGSLDANDLQILVAMLKGEKAPGDNFSACDFNHSGHVDGLDVIYFKSLLCPQSSRDSLKVEAAISNLEAGASGNSYK